MYSLAEAAVSRYHFHSDEVGTPRSLPPTREDWETRVPVSSGDAHLVPPLFEMRRKDGTHGEAFPYQSLPTGYLTQATEAITHEDWLRAASARARSGETTGPGVSVSQVFDQLGKPFSSDRELAF